MNNQYLLYAAALLIIAIGAAHSYLGERYLLIRLLRRDDLPQLFGGTEFTKRTLRFAWHITTVAWLGFAGVLIAIARDVTTPAVLGAIVGGTFLIHFGIALLGSRGRHYSWVVFLAIGILSLLATR